MELAVAATTQAAACAVVLQAAANTVGHLIVEAHAIELAHRHVVHRVVRAAAIPRLEEARVASDDEMIGVRRIDPHRVIVFVVAHHRKLPRVAAVVREGEVHRHPVDAVRVLRIDAYLREVERTVVDRTHPLPGLSRIGGLIDTREELLRLYAAHAIGLDHHVENAGVTGRDIDVHAALRRFWESAAFDLGPTAAAVRGLPESGARAARLEERRLAQTFVRCSVEHFRIARIHRDVDEARLVADELDQVPALSAVRGLVHPAFGIVRPDGAECGDVDDVRIGRVDDDATDVLRLLESDRCPADAAVGGLIDAVPRGHAVARVLLTGADIDGVRARRRDGDVADRGDRHVVPDGEEGRARIDRLPDAGTATRDVEDP